MRRALLARALLVAVVLAGLSAGIMLLVGGSFEQQPFHVAVAGLCAGSLAHMMRARRLSWIGCCFVVAGALIAVASL